MPYADPIKQREYQRKRVAKARCDWVAANGPCWCGSSEKLEVDHIDPSLKVDHKVWSWAEPRRLQELSKCQVLCHTHHMEKTLAQREHTQHGKIRKYNLGCRCLSCKATKSRINAKRKR